MRLLESCNCLEKDGMEAKIPGRIAEKLRSGEGRGGGVPYISYDIFPPRVRVEAISRLVKYA